MDDEFQIYSLVSIGMYPKEFFAIKRGETITLEISAVPFKEILRDKRGIYAFEYQIKGKKTGFFKDTLAIKILDVKDAVSVSIEDIPLNATKTKLTVINKEDIIIIEMRVNHNMILYQTLKVKIFMRIMYTIKFRILV